MAKKSKDSLTYFLDHPQIKRHPSPGNGKVPTAAPAPGTPAPTGSSKPSIAQQINFGGKFKK